MADDDDSTSIRDLLTGAKPAPHDFPQLDPADLPDDPIDLVIAWIRDAVAHDAAEPNAVVLATADAEGRPSARTLLLKDVTPTVDDEPGALWFSSLADSPKGRDLEANPRAALVAYWRERGRQIRATGPVFHGDREVSERDFLARHPASRAEVIAGDQSEPMPDAAERATPRIPGRRVVPVSRAARTAITTKTDAMPHCATTVPHADPAMPNPRP
nr:pyridoxamine 5'-phosphate oxidase family protein [Clavibacter michiganensis]